ncbi:hypothetical protein BSL78_11723 [Apostichopus japonicus]|uniref:EGF-like domain-containing protein n=1 Tax=Stichopus japonicus TaxID=307972 RepID=A0A2G8KTS8_STIJA|nr:hypothetical protein BSL78_11723 [Apostichopus japonicus]
MDISDPCEDRPCENQGTCVVLSLTEGSYSCLCVQGFAGLNCEADTMGKSFYSAR